MNKIPHNENNSEMQAVNHKYLTGRGYKYIPGSGVTV